MTAPARRRWPHLEKLAIKRLTNGDVRAATKTPADLEAKAVKGFYRVTRGPGSDDGVTDSPLLDVESFATTESRAWELAEDARQVVHELRGRAVDGVLVDTVSTASGPVLVDWGNPGIHRYVASYRFAFRKQ